jgi:hypothetical protein
MVQYGVERLLVIANDGGTTVLEIEELTRSRVLEPGLFKASDPLTHTGSGGGLTKYGCKTVDVVDE